MVIFRGKKKEGPTSSGLPEKMDLIVYLKLLTVFALHEAEIRNRAKAGLFGIKEIILDENTGTPLRLSKGQKHGDLHWRVYTIRAQERFAQWWKHLAAKYGEDSHENLALLNEAAQPIQDLVLPPIDILMIWHAYMLNPRNYLTDCIRASLSRLWCTPFPWKLVDQCITSHFEYTCSTDHISQWMADTSIPWFNEDSDNMTARRCRFCREEISITICKPIEFRCDSWLKKKKQSKSSTYGNISVSSKTKVVGRDSLISRGKKPKEEKRSSNSENSLDQTDFAHEVSGDEFWEDDDTLYEESFERKDVGGDSSGDLFSGSIPVFCDKQASFLCQSCEKQNTHADLSLGRLIRDIENVNHKIPLLGATLKLNGTPLVQVNALQFFEAVLPALNAIDCSKSSEKSFRKEIIKILRKNRVEKSSRLDFFTTGKSGLADFPIFDEVTERRAILYRIQCYYLDDLNSSDLSLCLYQAVVRQGSFTNKMNESGWLKSIKLKNITSQCILKYSRFIQLLATRLPENRNDVCVPTLDIDLAWHTHQLSPKSYYAYTVKKSKQFIDHDDKISNFVLDSAFENTAIRYFKTYNEPYTTCYCSYCLQMQFSVVQAPTAKLMFGRKISKAVDNSASEMSHVSAHNVVFLPSYKSLKSRLSKSASFDKAAQNSYEKSIYPYSPYIFNQIYGLTPPCDRSGVVDPDTQKNCAACAGLGRILSGNRVVYSTTTTKSYSSNTVSRNGVTVYSNSGYGGYGMTVVASDAGSSCHHNSSSSSTDNHCSSSNQSSTSSSACGSSCGSNSASNCGSSCGSSCGGGYS